MHLTICFPADIGDPSYRVVISSDRSKLAAFALATM